MLALELAARVLLGGAAGEYGGVVMPSGWCPTSACPCTSWAGAN